MHARSPEKREARILRGWVNSVPLTGIYIKIDWGMVGGAFWVSGGIPPAFHLRVGVRPAFQ